MEKIGHFKKNVKSTCNLIFPKCFVALEKWVAGRSQFHICTNFTKHFSGIFFFDSFKSLIYIIKSYIDSSYI